MRDDIEKRMEEISQRTGGLIMDNKKLKEVIDNLSTTLADATNAIDTAIQGMKELPEKLEAIAQGKLDDEMDERYGSYVTEKRKSLDIPSVGDNVYFVECDLSTNICGTLNFGAKNNFDEKDNNLWKSKETAENVAYLMKSLFTLIHKGHDLTISVQMEDGEDVKAIEWELGEVTVDYSKEL